MTDDNDSEAPDVFEETNVKRALEFQQTRKQSKAFEDFFL